MYKLTYDNRNNYYTIILLYYNIEYYTIIYDNISNYYTIIL